MRVCVWFFGLMTFRGACKVSPGALNHQVVLPPNPATEQGLKDVDSVSGFCPKENVVQPIAARTGDIQACYEKQLKRRRKLAGRVELSWTLGRDGRVVVVETVPQEQLEVARLAVARRSAQGRQQVKGQA